MLVSYLLKPSVHGHSLDELALERLSRKPLTPKDVGWDKGQEPAVGDSRLAAYAAERVEIARRMAEAMRRELEAGSLARVYTEIEAPLVPVLLRMEEAGILLDVGLPPRDVGRAGSGDRHPGGEIYKEAGETVQPQLAAAARASILFEKMGLPVLKKTQKTKSYSTGAETLEELAGGAIRSPSSCCATAS